MEADTGLERADKISLVNALMAEDREELRFHKNILFNATIVFISGYVGVAAYFMNSFWSHNLNSYQYYLPIIAIGMLFGFYLIIFLFLRQFVGSVRKSLDIREQYYKNSTLLDTEQPFRPLKGIHEAGIESPSIPDNYLVALLVAAFTAATANSLAVYYIFTHTARQ
jgi:hypothetical protein